MTSSTSLESPTLRRSVADTRAALTTIQQAAASLRATAESTHRLYRDIERDIPDSLRQPSAAGTTAVGVRHSALMLRAYAAFKDALTAYLALNQLTASAEKNNVAELLLSKSEEEFRAWLDRADKEGALNG